MIANPELDRSLLVGPFRLPRSQRSALAAGYLTIVAFLTSMQLLMGADLWVLGVLVLLAITSLIPFTFRSWSAADILWVAYAAYAGFMPLAVKCYVAQTVDSNLTSPHASSTYFLVGNLSALCGYLFVRRYIVPARAPFNIGALSAMPDFISRFAIPLFAIGFVAQGLHTVLRRHQLGSVDADTGFGGFGAITVLALIGFTMQAARWRQRDSGALALPVMGAMLGLLIVLAVFSNIKKPVFDALLAAALVLVLIKGRKIQVRHLIVAALPIAALLLYVTPLIHIMRPQLKQYSVTEIYTLAAKVLSDAKYSPSILSDKADSVARGYSYSFRRGGNYLYPSPLNADRFAIIMPTDQVVRGLPDRGVMGLSTLADIPEAYLPGFLIQKKGIASEDIIAWHYGIRKQDIVGRPVIGLVASSIALGGMIGAIIMPALTIVLFFGVINLIAGPIGNSPWAVVLLASTIQLTGERVIAGLVNVGARQFPVLIGCAFLLSFLYLRISKRGRYMRRRRVANVPPARISREKVYD